MTCWSSAPPARYADHTASGTALPPRLWMRPGNSSPAPPSSLSSPAPPYNFATLPQVEDVDAFWDMKQRGVAYKRPDRYVDLVLPKNSFIAAFIGGLVVNTRMNFLGGFLAIGACLVPSSSDR